jgi:Sec-independent protein translocase protein TatA
MSLTEILIILLIALVVLGPERLPTAARKLGEWFRELRRMSNLFRETLMLEEDGSPHRDPGWPEAPRDDTTTDSETPASAPGPIDQGPLEVVDEPPSEASEPSEPEVAGAIPRRELAGVHSVELEGADTPSASRDVSIPSPDLFDPARTVPLPLPALPRF